MCLQFPGSIRKNKNKEGSYTLEALNRFVEEAQVSNRAGVQRGLKYILTLGFGPLLHRESSARSSLPVFIWRPPSDLTPATTTTTTCLSSDISVLTTTLSTTTAASTTTIRTTDMQATTMLTAIIRMASTRTCQKRPTMIISIRTRSSSRSPSSCSMALPYSHRAGVQRFSPRASWTPPQIRSHRPGSPTTVLHRASRTFLTPLACLSSSQIPFFPDLEADCFR